MEYKQINLVKYIENRNNEFNKELNLTDDNKQKLTELKMHKILYFLYGLYYQKYKKELYNADFRAYKYGPVEINYRVEGKRNSNIFDIEVNADQLDFLDKTLKRLFWASTFALVEKSHQTLPWIKNYKEGKSQIKISKQDIIDYFCS